MQSVFQSTLAAADRAESHPVFGPVLLASCVALAIGLLCLGLVAAP
jgi:hypothetical protein